MYSFKVWQTLELNRSRSSVTKDQRSESSKEFVRWSLLVMLMTPPWIASVMTVTGRHSGLRIARLIIHVASLAHAGRMDRARERTPMSTLIMNVSSSGSRNGGKPTYIPSPQLKKDILMK